MTARWLRGLEHPPLGLVLILAAAYVLPMYASMVVSVAELGSWHDSVSGVVILELATIALQVATGAAIAWRWHARPIFAAYAVCACVAAAVGACEMADGAATSAALAIETIGWPIVVLAAPWCSDCKNERSADEVAAVLLTLGVSGILGTALNTFQNVRMFAHADMSTGAWVGQAILPAISVVSAVLAILAGLRPTRARFLTYLLVTIGIHALWDIGATGLELATGDLGSHAHMVVWLSAAGFATSVITPLALWAYASDRLDGTGRARPHVLAWCVLGFAPPLLARWLLVGDLTRLVGSSLAWTIALCCVALGILLAAAAIATLRQARPARVLALGVAVLAVVIAGIAIVGFYVTSHDRFERAPFGPLALLVATTAMLAWLQMLQTAAPRAPRSV